MRHVDGGPAGHELEVHLDEGRVWVTDIVIAMASRPKIALLNALLGPGAKEQQGNDARWTCKLLLPQ